MKVLKENLFKMSDNFTDELLKEMENGITTSQDEEINMNHVKFEMIPGLRDNSQLMWAYEEQQLYYENSYSQKSKITAFTGRKSGCMARVFLKEDGTVFKSDKSIHLASHGSQYPDYKLMNCQNKMKERAKCAPASMLPYDIYMEAVTEYDILLLNTNMLLLLHEITLCKLFLFSDGKPIPYAKECLIQKFLKNTERRWVTFENQNTEMLQKMDQRYWKNSKNPMYRRNTGFRYYQIIFHFCMMQS